jgi:hypothetical protein
MCPIILTSWRTNSPIHTISWLRHHDIFLCGWSFLYCKLIFSTSVRVQESRVCLLTLLYRTVLPRALLLSIILNQILYSFLSVRVNCMVRNVKFQPTLIVSSSLGFKMFVFFIIIIIIIPNYNNPRRTARFFAPSQTSRHSFSSLFINKTDLQGSMSETSTSPFN